MPDSETFDAFYARTVWRVTTQMHELAGDDGLADHAIREAYAKAYQQWYQVSGYRDSEEWVLATATEAYERRRAEAEADHHPGVAQIADSGTWPGIYRPRTDAGDRADADQDQPALDPDATVARPRRHAAARMARNLAPSAPAAADYPTTGPMAGSPGPQAQTRQVLRASRPGLGQLGSRRTQLIAGSAVAALLIASIAYFASGGHKATPTAGSGSSPSVVTKPKVQMLPAGKTGDRSAVPWSLVRQGWALAEFSTAPPNSAGQASGTGTYTTFLVDPEGGKYKITTSSGGAEPQLMAWSGDARNALLGTSGGTSSYQLLNVQTGQFATLRLPVDVVAVGFTRPDGLNILAVHQGPAEFRLQRYSLTGVFQATLGSLPRKPDEAWLTDGCSSACALSSPNGDFAVWGFVGDEMQLLNNAGGMIRKLHVKSSGKPPSCVPVSWWDTGTILAKCGAAGTPGDRTRLWLVPADGGSPTALTAAAGGPSGSGDLEGAWQVASAVYISATSSNQCPTAPSGPGGVDIEQLGQAGPGSTVTIPGGTGYVNMVVGSSGKRLLVLAQTHCPGTSSLLWFNPTTGRSQIVIGAPGNEVGVIAAVPFGNGPTAVASGQG